MSKSQTESVLGIYDYNTFFRYDPLKTPHNYLQYVKMHELMHLILGNFTHFGVINQIIDQLTWKTKEKTIPLAQISKVLAESSKKAHEGIATYTEFALLKYNVSETIFNLELSKLRDYNKEYYKYLLPFIPFLQLPNWEVIYKLHLIPRIGMLAFNIDLSTLPIAIIKNPKKLKNIIQDTKYVDLYRPNTRIKRLVNVLLDLLTKHDVCNISDEMIKKHSGMQFLEPNKKNQLKLIEWLLAEFKTSYTEEELTQLHKYAINDLSGELPITNEEMLRRVLYSAQPTVLNDKYIISDIETEDVRNVIDDSQVLYASINKDDVILLSSNIFQSVNYRIKTNIEYLEVFVTEINKPLIISHENFDEVSKDARIANVMQKADLFIFIDIPYVASRDFINDNISIGKEIMLIKFNENFYFLFIKIKNGKVMVQKIDCDCIKLIIDDIISNKYNYINTGNMPIDGCFYNSNTDWAKYDNIICSLSNINYFEFCQKDLGQRIILQKEVLQQIKMSK